MTLYVDNGTPYVAYEDTGNSHKATVMKYNGSSWASVGPVGFSSGIVFSISLSVYSGTPYISCDEDIISGGSTVVGAVMSYNGSWNDVGGIPFLSCQPGYDCVGNTSVALYNGTPYVTFGGGANVMTFTGSAWTTVGGGDFGSDSNGMAIQVYNGTPYVAYADSANNLKATVMYHP
jgi:hypothetical protein